MACTAPLDPRGSMGCAASPKSVIAPETPARQRIPIDHGKLENGLGGADHGRHVEPIEVPVGEGGDKILEAARPVPIPAPVVGGLEFGDPVDELAAVGMVAHRVNHHLAGAEPASAHHAGAGQKGWLAGHPAPHVDAGIDRLALVGVELPAHGRMNTVAGNQDRSDLARQAGPSFVLELSDGRTTGLRCAGAAPAEVQAFGAEALRAWLAAARPADRHDAWKAEAMGSRHAGPPPPGR